VTGNPIVDTWVHGPPPDDEQPARDDEELAELSYAARLASDVEKKARDMRVVELARAKLAADKVAAADYGDLYLDRAGLLDLPAPEPLIERVLPRHAYVILRGRDHSFKSFVAIDWALCLATGKAWQTHAVEPVRVLYIAGEGAHGLRARVDAWEYAWGHNVPPHMLTVRRTALDMHQPGPAYTHLLDHVASGSYGLVVVDTLRRVSGAADGNGSEMGLVVDNLDRIKQATDNGTVLAVAHTDKGDHDTRGYSGIEDDADVVWAAKRDDMLLSLELTKMKDGPDGSTVHLQAQRTLNSLVLSGTTGTPKVDTTESQDRILQGMRDMFPDGVTGTELLATIGLPKATFYRALADLTAGGHLVNTGDKRRRFYELPALLTDDTPEDSQ
jgi:hypothetical protein